jgi:hypothetical protein
MADGEDWLELAERVRRACVEAALAGYEDAAQAGLCHEGAWEAAVSAIRRVDVAALAERGETDPRQRGR